MSFAPVGRGAPYFYRPRPTLRSLLCFHRGSCRCPSLLTSSGWVPAGLWDGDLCAAAQRCVRLEDSQGLAMQVDETELCLPADGDPAPLPRCPPAPLGRASGERSRIPAAGSLLLDFHGRQQRPLPGEKQSGGLLPHPPPQEKEKSQPCQVEGITSWIPGLCLRQQRAGNSKRISGFPAVPDGTFLEHLKVWYRTPVSALVG